MILLLFVVFATINATTIWVTNLAGGIFKSVDDGATFFPQSSGVTSAFRSIQAKSSTEVWAVGDNGVVKVTTDGNTWTTKNLGTTSNLNSVFWVSATNGFIGGISWAGGLNFFAFSTDSGTTFTPTSTAGVGAKAIFFVSSSVGWVAVGSQIIKTTNGGVNFVGQTVPTNSGLNSVSFIDVNTGVTVGLSGFIARTVNGGTTWTQITSPTVSTINYVKFVSATVGYAGYVSGLLKTVDAGASWSTVSGVTTTSFNSLDFSGTTDGWIAGGVLQRTSNSGTSWTTLTNPSPSSVITSLTINGTPLPTTTTTTGSSTLPPVTYQVTQFFSNDLTCSNAFTAMQIVQSASCTPSSTCTNVNNNFGSKVSCVTAPPQYPSGWAALEIWVSSSGCSGTSDGILVAPADTCTGKWSLATMQMNCSNNVILDCSATVSGCGGCSSKSATQGGSCVTGNPVTSLAVQSYKWTCTSSSTTVCFHGTTEILYNSPDVSASFVLENLKGSSFLEKECRIPHIVKSDGVAIESDCDSSPLRLTRDHLVFTSEGLLAAGDIVAGNVLQGVDGKSCKVTRRYNEKNQMYYGLNCKESVVYANGVKCSTFGKLHALPSLWMKYVSKIVGIETASKVGDFLARLYANVIG